ncbi:xanthine dehydrogenase family protein molybdopterin-binding subunit [Desulforamulus aquiferis]|uniref:Molybdopterin-dependent oxidoreductase n=1 Tax=Desulforamulus aquiferis TaxID=1397668 RepID=A0AAW7Z8J8_9FIRM|nr:molybdopterin cofactor-binding domain-containing protein [Desulforamulus aquiferis]MDO7785742.1 molybdopterin-dependent oxidoreductase [Desulforamulus aquiferis]
MKKRGRGIGCNLYGVGFGFNRPDHSSAYVEIADDGSVTLLSGCSEIGQGSDTVLCQIAAEELGIPFEWVRIISGDSGVTPDGGPSTASRQTYVSGNAVKKAAEDAKSHMIQLASEILKCTIEELMVANQRITSIKDEHKTIAFATVASEAHKRGKPFIGHGWHDNTTSDVDPETNQGDAYSTYIYATQVADVEVDTETGEVKVLQVVAAHDCGRAINPQLVEAQIEGAVAQGLGYALMEEVILNDGRTLTPTFAEFLIPTSLDVPEVIPIIVEDLEYQGPFQAKGVGEGAIIPTAAAIINAIYDAVGVRINSLPATPDKILALLKGKEM